jgi:hypothetical protein
LRCARRPTVSTSTPPTWPPPASTPTSCSCDVTQRAQATIARIDKLKDLLDLSADLLSLGAAIATGKPDHILAPFEKLKQHLATL